MSIATPVIETRTSLLDSTQDVVFSGFTPVATNSPTLWEAEGLPAGLSINASTGEITGTPTVAGIFHVLLKASNFDTRVFTVVAGTDIFTALGNAFVDTDIVDVLSDDTLPAPLTANTDYHIRDKSSDTNKVAAAAGGAALDVTDTGTGVHTMRKKQTHQITITMPVYSPTPAPPENDIATLINVDIDTGAVTLPGIPEKYEFGPPISALRKDGLQYPTMRVKQDDRFPVEIGIMRAGVLLDLTLGILKIKGKEYAPEQELTLTDHSWTKQNAGIFTRYRAIMHMEADVWQASLSNYDQDSDIYFDSLAEIEFTVVNDSNVFSMTLIHPLSPDLANNDSQVDVLSFVGFPLSATATEYAVTLDLAVTGRATQNVSLGGTGAEITFDAAWNAGTGVFDVTNIAGTLTGSGDSDPAHWESTLTQTSVVGTADGVDITVTTTTSNESACYLEIDLAYTADWTITGSGVAGTNELTIDPYAGGGNLNLEIREEVGGGSGDFESFNFYDGDTGAAMKILLDALGTPFDNDTASVVLDYDRQVIVIIFNSSYDTAEIADTDETPEEAWQTVCPGADDHAATVTGQVTGDAVDDTYRKSSETFILRAEKDVIANT